MVGGEYWRMMRRFGWLVGGGWWVNYEERKEVGFGERRGIGFI